MKKLKKFLQKNDACSNGFEFAKDLTLEEFLSTCDRGDWILWLFRRTNTSDKRTRVLVAAHCANTVRHLMKDERSTNAVDIAIKYGNNQATEQELADAAADAAAYAAADAAAYDAAYAAADAAAYAAAAAAAAAADAAAAYAAAADAADAAAYAAAADAADAAAYAAAADARKQNQKLTADICRQYLPLEIWDQSKIK